MHHIEKIKTPLLPKCLPNKADTKNDKTEHQRGKKYMLSLQPTEEKKHTINIWCYPFLLSLIQL